MRVGRALRQHEAPPIAPSFAHAAALLGIQCVGVGRAAGEAIGNAVAKLVDDDAVVEVAVAARVRERELVHLHARREPLGGGRHVSVVGRAGIGRVLGVGLEGVAADSQPAVVPDLEVPGDLVKAVAEVNVVSHVVGIEEIHDSCVFVLCRGGSPRGVERVTAEVEARTPGGPTARVGHIITVAVQVSMGVVAASVGEFSPRDAVRVVPAKRRRHGIGRVVDGRETAVVHVFGGQFQTAIGRMVHPVMEGCEFARRGIGADIIPMHRVGGANHEVPSQRQPLGSHHILQFGGNVIQGQTGGAKRGRPVQAAAAAKHLNRLTRGQIHFLRHRGERGDGIQSGRRDGAIGLPHPRDKGAVCRDHLPGRGHVHVEQGVRDGKAVVRLAQVDVRGAGTSAGIMVGDHVIRHVGSTDLQGGRMVGDIVDGDVKSIP